MGVWIETIIGLEPYRSEPSHPAWVCGLKQNNPGRNVSGSLSHPAWVCGLKRLERRMILSNLKSHPAWVCGLKLMSYVTLWIMVQSHPAWVCGLKPRIGLPVPSLLIRHTLRGCVD